MQFSCYLYQWRSFKNRLAVKMQNSKDCLRALETQIFITARKSSGVEVTQETTLLLTTFPLWSHLPKRRTASNERARAEKKAGGGGTDQPRRRRCPCAWWTAGRRRAGWTPIVPLQPPHQPAGSHGRRLQPAQRLDSSGSRGARRRPGLFQAAEGWEQQVATAKVCGDDR